MNERCQRAFAWIDQHREDSIELWKDLVRIESFSSDKAGVDRLGDFIAEAARSRGFTAELHPFPRAGNGLRITTGPAGPLPAVSLLGHMDTVFAPGSFLPLVREEDGKLRGPGAFDMKGGIAMALLVMEALRETGYADRELRLILIGDEEVGEALSGQEGVDFIRDSVRGSGAVFNCESGHPGSITVARRGSINYMVDIQGKSAHAGSAYLEGISAIREAAHKILEIEQDCDPLRITYNCGVISGGTVSNAVPEHCRFEIDCRFATVPQLAEARAHIEGVLNHAYVPGTTCTYEIRGQREPMERNERNMGLFAHIRRVSREFDLGDVEPIARGGGSDAVFPSVMGIPTVCSMGVVGSHSHSLDEYADINSFAVQAKRLAASILTLPETFPD